jgi:hypothetical protein
VASEKCHVEHRKEMVMKKTKKTVSSAKIIAFLK